MSITEQAVNRFVNPYETANRNNIILKLMTNTGEFAPEAFNILEARLEASKGHALVVIHPFFYEDSNFSNEDNLNYPTYSTYRENLKRIVLQASERAIPIIIFSQASGIYGDYDGNTNLGVYMEEEFSTHLEEDINRLDHQLAELVCLKDREVFVVPTHEANPTPLAAQELRPYKKTDLVHLLKRFGIQHLEDRLTWTTINRQTFTTPETRDATVMVLLVKKLSEIGVTNALLAGAYFGGKVDETNKEQFIQGKLVSKEYASQKNAHGFFDIRQDLKDQGLAHHVLNHVQPHGCVGKAMQPFIIVGIRVGISNALFPESRLPKKSEL